MSQNTSTTPAFGQQLLIVVLGMHRSGTSAVTRSLRALGVDLGDRLMPPVEGDNDKGFYEDLDLVALNEEMLEASGYSWDSATPLQPADIERLCQQGYLSRALVLLRTRLGVYPVFGMKDPRIAKLMPFWQKVFAAAGVKVRYVLAYRNPLSVAQSLQARNGFASNKSFLLIADYLITSLNLLDAENMALIDYDQLMLEPERQLTMLGQRLGLSVDPQELEEYCASFLESRLRHSQFAPRDLEFDATAVDLVKNINAFICSVLDGTATLESLVDSGQLESWRGELLRWRAALQLVDTQCAQLGQLEQGVDARDAEIKHISNMVHERDAQLHELNLALHERNAQLDEQSSTIQQRDARLLELTQLAQEREQHVTELSQALNEREGHIQGYEARLHEQSGAIQQLQEQIQSLTRELDQHRWDLGEYVFAYQSMLTSTSWRLTAPLRLGGTSVRDLKRALRLIPDIARAKGGYRESARLAFRILRTEGLIGVRARILRVEREKSHQQLTAETAEIRDKASFFEVVPHYIAPEMHSQPVPEFAAPRVAVHLHLFYEDQLDDLIIRLELIPCSFDLFVSVPENINRKQIRTALRKSLDQCDQIVVECVPNRGRNLAPLIVQFGQRLTRYDVVGHFHTKKPPHNSGLSNWCAELLDQLFGKPGATGARLAHFFQELAADTKLIYGEGRLEFIKDPAGWDDDYAAAKRLLEQYTELDIADFQKTEVPEGAMFWARTACLHEMLTLPLKYTDFEPEPIGADGSLAHAIERLILIFASQHQGRNLRLHQRDSIPDYTSYEVQKDFSSLITDKKTRVLAYYLPQFHPTPENDEWHGKGFTEWTKVRAANPLFEGHYQQHIPHEDIGYYLLDSPETLRQQAETMRQAGVFGQIFYHYWFGGRMILENPARMLLANKDIQMPFCFCWANENWTRRWDGNESEVLLAQDYSVEDAKGFIRYLIPFFKDERYIHVGERPVLFVYRSSSIPDTRQYLDVWAEECLAAGLQPPYVVAVLTRGATHPDDFGMDAGTERVLHDWTAGNAPDIKQHLRPYSPINGSVLHYDDVADYYSQQAEKKDFTYFRNIVPMWDNTARYGSEAYVVHGSSPQRFQRWFEQLVDYGNKHLPDDRRFVLVNAWNEWAEGAHLEPDNRYGYSYLNSIGRALSGIPYESQLNQGLPVSAGSRLHVEFPPHLVDLLKSDVELAERYLYGLRRALAHTGCKISVNQESASYLPGVAHADEAEADFILELRSLAFFRPDAIDRLLQTAVAEGEAMVIANVYGGDEPLIEIHDNGTTSHDALYSAPMILKPRTLNSIKKVCVRADTHIFVTQPDSEPVDSLPEITTVIRIHHKADITVLHHALGCLAAMRNSICVPLITAQDFDDEQKVELGQILDSYQLRGQRQARVIHFASVGGAQDLRSKMLNEGLKAVETRYAAFLDYDDLLINHAYDWLYQGLRKSGKAVTFARVYAASYESSTGRFLGRSTPYEYGSSYDEFVSMNHAPLHSFLLDMSKLDLSGIEYHDEHKYMEDYYLTLQLFTRDNADWESLSTRKYVGDYIYSVDRKHTLAFSCEQERKNILNDSLYQECEDRIQKMRRKVRQS